MKQITWKFLLAVLCIYNHTSQANIIDLIGEDENLFNEINLDKEKIKEIISFIFNKENYWHPQWQYQYGTLLEFIQKNNFKKGCEIGVAFGGQSLAILSKTKIEKLYSVDPYYNFPTEIYPDSLNYNQNIHDVLYYYVKKKLEPFKERSKLLRMTSVQAANLVKENELDFVYIDGNHSYEYVKLDILSWFNKVRPGGLIIGDDWQAPGVRKAVNELLGQYKLYRKARMWWIQK